MLNVPLKTASPQVRRPDIPLKSSRQAFESGDTTHLPRFQFNLCHQYAHERHEWEQFIAHCYWSAYKAIVKAFPPLMLTMKTAESGGSQKRLPVAAAGLRFAAEEPLMSEAYLREPADQAIATALSQSVTRDSLVEIGSLAAMKKGSSQALFVVLAAALEAAGIRWLVFAGTPQVHKLITRFGYTPVTLREADPQCLGEQAKDWGCYYDTRPQVMVCDVSQALESAETLRLTRTLLSTQAATVCRLSSLLRDYRRLMRNAYV